MSIVEAEREIAQDPSAAENLDLAGKDYWDNMYAEQPETRATWQPISYEFRAIEWALLGEIERCKPESLLEVGCGNSTWLGYLAKRCGIPHIAGIDYAPEGCRLARKRLETEGVEGDICEMDIFDGEAEHPGQYDFVYSLGLVEHFVDLPDTLRALLSLVRPGGTLFTEIPNLNSVTGLASWAFYPSKFVKHVAYGKRDLVRTYKQLGMVDVRGSLLGLTTPQLISSGGERRWLRVPNVLLPLVHGGAEICDRILRLTGCYRGVPGLAPFVYVVGRKPLGADEVPTPQED